MNSVIATEVCLKTAGQRPPMLRFPRGVDGQAHSLIHLVLLLFLPLATHPFTQPANIDDVHDIRLSLGDITINNSFLFLSLEFRV